MDNKQEKIREAFQRVAKDINSLYGEIYSLRLELRETRTEMLKICEILEHLSQRARPIYLPTHITPITTDIPTHRHINQADRQQASTREPIKQALFSLKTTKNKPFSTGNEGVPTDRQTDRQTDNSPLISYENTLKILEKSPKTTEKQAKISEKPEKTLQPQDSPQNSLNQAARMFDSLDSIKKELRITFKKLTEQELLVFSAIYQLDEEKGFTDYKTLAEKLSLTESSIRDYVGRLLKKGIPIEKTKVNNKTICLSISKNLKKIASLASILQLRDL